MSRAQVWL